MLQEAIESICAAEESAKQSILHAQQAAQDSVADADKAGEQAIARTLARAESEIAYLTRAAESKVTGDALELASKTANRQATIRARGERLLEDAARYIVERIVNT